MRRRIVMATVALLCLVLAGCSVNMDRVYIPPQLDSTSLQPECDSVVKLFSKQADPDLAEQYPLIVVIRDARPMTDTTQRVVVSVCPTFNQVVPGVTLITQAYSRTNSSGSPVGEYHDRLDDIPPQGRVIVTAVNADDGDTAVLPLTNVYAVATGTFIPLSTSSAR